MIVLDLTAEMLKSVVHQNLMSKRHREHTNGGLFKEAVLYTLRSPVSPVSWVFVQPRGDLDWEMNQLKN